MSRGLAKFVKALMGGLEVGGRLGDRWATQQYRRDALEVSRQKNKADAIRHRERMDIDRQKAGAYVNSSNANAEKARAAAKKLLGGGGGAATSSAATQGFLNQYGAGVPQDQPAQQPTYAAPQAPEADTPVEQPPAGYADQADTAARGGRMRQRSTDYGGLAYRVASAMQRPRGNGGTPPFNSNPASHGTSGPGSGMGEQAAPPSAINTSGIPVEDMFSGAGSTFRTGGAVRAPTRAYKQGGLVMNTPAYLGASQAGENYDRDARGIPELPDGNPDWMTDVQNDDPRLQYEIEMRNRSEAFPGSLPNQQDDVLLGRQQEFQGETGRANEGGGPGTSAPRPSYREQFAARREAERPPPGPPMRDVGETGGQPEMATRDPGETGGQPEPMPQRGAPSASGGAGARSAINTAAPTGGGGGGGGRGGAPRGGALRDQSREKAYDPVADLYDPDNAHIVDAQGQVKAALSGAASYASRVFGGGPQGQIQGQAGGEGGGGAGMHPDQAKAALFSGKGAADPKMMNDVFKAIDPENKMSMDQKMKLAMSQAYAFGMKSGNKEEAEQSAFQIAQFGNKVASDHGKEALKLMQAGNQQGALDMLIKGYNFLPDGYTASYEGGNIVLKDEQGNVGQSYKLDARAMQNIALGMASGQLGWDVIKMGGQQQAQASAPPAGAAPPRAGPPTAAPPVAARPQQVAQPAAAPAGPQTQTPAAPATPPAAPAPGPAASAGGTAPPAPAGAPARTKLTAPEETTTEPNVAAGATPPGVAQGDAQTKPNLDTTKKPDGLKQRTVEDDEAEHFKKNPYAPLPKIVRTTSQEPREVAAIKKQIIDTETQFEKDRQQMLKDAATAKLNAPKQDRAAIDRVIAHHDKRFADWKKEANAALVRAQTYQQQQDTHEKTSDLKPRQVSMADEKVAEEKFAQRGVDTLAAAQRETRISGPEKEAGDKRKSDYANTVLRYAKTPEDLAALNRVAKAIWMANPKMDVNTAYDAALASTAIKPPSKDGKNDVGMNYQRGQFATHFKPVGGNLRRGVVLQFPDPNEPGNPRGGRQVHVDEETYNEIKQLHRANWGAYVKGEEKRKEDDEKRAKGKTGLRALIPDVSIIGGGLANGR